MEGSGGGVTMAPKVSKNTGSGGADPQLVEAAAKFVSEVIERAKEEAGRRRAQQKSDAAGARAGTEGGDAAARKVHLVGGGSIPGGAIPWHSRARGLISRLLSSFCFRGTTAAARTETPKNS